MPYISFKTNHKLTLRQENTIKSKSGELISLIPGKTEKALYVFIWKMIKLCILKEKKLLV